MLLTKPEDTTPYLSCWCLSSVQIFKSNLLRTGEISISASLALWATFVLSGGYLLGGAPIYAVQNDAFTACHRIGIPLFLFALALVCSVQFNRYTVLRILQKHYKGLWPPIGLVAEEEMKKLERFVLGQIEPCIESGKHLNPPWQCWTEEERSRYLGATATACKVVSPQAKVLFEEFEAVTSLDYLFKAAHDCEFALRDRVLMWASRSCGYLLHTNSTHTCSMMGGGGGDMDSHGNGNCSSFVRANNVNILCNCIKWCSNKAIERAVEKSIRCYNGNVSELLDICRQLIVFDTISDIHRCLEEIHKDKTVRIVRIKNRLTPDYNAAEITGGYRDVALNIRMSSLSLHSADYHHAEEEEQGGRKRGEELRVRKGRRHTEDGIEEEEGSGVSGMRPGENANSDDRSSCQRGHHPATEHICEIQLMLREFALVLFSEYYAMLCYIKFGRCEIQLFLRKFTMVMLFHFVLTYN
jgi:hypothetical protein